MQLTRAHLLDALLAQLQASTILSDALKDDFTVKLNLTETEVLLKIYNQDGIGQAEKAARNAKTVHVLQ